jgi:hypothetical protein
MRRDREQIIIAGTLKAVATPRAIVFEQKSLMLCLALSVNLQVVLHEISDLKSFIHP